MDDPIAEILERLIDAKRAEAGWKARCPAHEDRHASLTVAAGWDGRVLVKCHAGCPVDAVVAALKMTTADLFPRPTGQAGARRRRAGRITEYVIRGPDGEVAAIHVRRDRDDGTKEMWWQRPDGSRGLGGRARDDLPLYNSERLRGWPTDAVIVIVEGEKAADALVAAGVPAPRRSRAPTAAPTPGRWLPWWAAA